MKIVLPGGRFRPFVLISLLTMIAGLSGRPARSAPGFIESGRFHELNERIVAEDDDGPVSALDVLFYLNMTRSPLESVDVDAWLGESEDKRERERLRTLGKIRRGVEEYLAARSLARGRSVPAAPEFFRRALLFPAAEAAWIDRFVIPDVKVDPVDVNRYYIMNPGKFVSPERVQVRYLYRAVEDPLDVNAIREAEFEVGAIRDRIEAGALSFEEAARRFSEAPSRVQGGLIPPFTPGTHFEEFEYQAFSLKREGDLSPVFVGNEGVYLMQLVSRTDSQRRTLAEVQPEIRATLKHEHAAPYYRLYRGRLGSKIFTRNLALNWTYASLETPVATVGDKDLTRDMLLRINPNIVNANYDVQWRTLFAESSAWIEGETIMRNLEEQGLAGHPLIEQAGGIFDQVLASRAALDRAVDPSVYRNLEGALRALGSEDPEELKIPRARVIQIKIGRDKKVSAEPLSARRIAETMDELAAGVEEGYLPTQPESIEYAQTLRLAADDGKKALAEAVQWLRDRLKESRWPGVKIELADMGWRDVLPGIAFDENIVGLEPGQTTPPLEDRNENIIFFNVADVRMEEGDELLRVPILLQAAAYELARAERLEQEIEKVRREATIRWPGVEEPGDSGMIDLPVEAE